MMHGMTGKESLEAEALIHMWVGVGVKKAAAAASRRRRNLGPEDVQSFLNWA